MLVFDRILLARYVEASNPESGLKQRAVDKEMQDLAI